MKRSRLALVVVAALAVSVAAGKVTIPLVPRALDPKLMC